MQWEGNEAVSHRQLGDVGSVLTLEAVPQWLMLQYCSAHRVGLGRSFLHGQIEPEDHPLLRNNKANHCWDKWKLNFREHTMSISVVGF